MQSSHAGKQSYKNALSFFVSFVYLSGRPFHPHILASSLSLLSLLKYISPLRVGLTSLMNNNIFHFTLSYLHCFLLSHCRLIFWLETCSIATYRWFVYQNIDLFSLYMSMLASILLGLLWRTIFILTPACPWSSRWRQEEQERAGAVCVWGFLCLIGSVGLHVGSGVISLVPLRLIMSS